MSDRRGLARQLRRARASWAALLPTFGLGVACATGDTNSASDGGGTVDGTVKTDAGNGRHDSAASSRASTSSTSSTSSTTSATSGSSTVTATDGGVDASDGGDASGSSTSSESVMPASSSPGASSGTSSETTSVSSATESSTTTIAASKGSGGLDTMCTSGTECMSGVCEGGYCQEAYACTTDADCGVGPNGMNVCLNIHSTTPSVGVCHPTCFTTSGMNGQGNCPGSSLCCNGTDVNRSSVMACSTCSE
jgi:hypothetical protein